ncbi:hypothetical protein [Nonomuraea dietziae]|uniref:hypothetical protein n=1 Tax=Nonomuraea dietziae TaxID=65515 RepID=UPI0031CF8F4A
MIGLSLVFTLYVQEGLHFSPLKAGLASLPQAVGGVVGFGIAMGAGRQARPYPSAARHPRHGGGRGRARR